MRTTNRTAALIRRLTQRSKALQAARSGKLPVWWEADTRDEIHRALDLAEEFGTTAVIVGGREAGKVADRLKSANVPVVLRLNFPTEPRVPTEEEYQKRAPAERDEPLRAARPPQDRVEKASRRRRPPWPRPAFASRSQRKASSGSTRSRRTVRQLMTAGLSADQALAGLTRNAAQSPASANGWGPSSGASSGT